jgi:hypothetical protein
MKRLREQGHTITYDWTGVEQESSAQAELDRDGVLDAEVLVMLAGRPNQYQFKGTWVEFGIAAGKGIPIFVVGDGADACIFSRLPNVRKFDHVNNLPFLMNYVE